MYLVQKKSGGNWYIIEASRGPDGKIKKVWSSTGTTDKAKAELIVAEIEASRRLVQTSVQTGLRDRIMERVMVTAQAVHEVATSWEGVWQIYLEDPRTRAMRNTTRHQVAGSFRRFVRWIQETAPGCTIQQTTHSHACSYIAQYQDRARSGTIELNRVHLHTIWKRVKRPLGLYENIWEDIYLPVEDDARSARCYNFRELLKIFRWAKGEKTGMWPLLIREGAYAGLRFSDACTLACEHIVGGRIVRKSYKTGTELDIPIHWRLWRYLEPAMSAVGGIGYVLPVAAKLYLGQNSSWRSRFADALDQLGIAKETPEGLARYHSFRHGFNTRLINKGTDPGVRCRLMGHRSIEVNQVYNHASRAEAEAIGRLAEVYNPRRNP